VGSQRIFISTTPPILIGLTCYFKLDGHIVRVFLCAHDPDHRVPRTVKKNIKANALIPLREGKFAAVGGKR
jgi:hypothetical protein